MKKECAFEELGKGNKGFLLTLCFRHDISD